MRGGPRQFYAVGRLDEFINRRLAISSKGAAVEIEIKKADPRGQSHCDT